jgi:hypothetical protein
MRIGSQLARLRSSLATHIIVSCNGLMLSRNYLLAGCNIFHFTASNCLQWCSRALINLEVSSTAY